MKLGTGLFTCQRRPDDDRSMAEIYEEMCTLARAVEAAGLDSAWISEHHFREDGYLSATMPTLGALAAETDEVEIGSCVALAPLYDAVRLAEDAATVDLLSGGRLTLGLAIGSNPREFDEFGVPPDERAERLEDAVRLLRAAWSDGPLAYDAAFHPVSPDVSVTPKPDREIPVVLGGSAKPAVRRAARTADAWCAPSALSVRGVEKRVEDARTVREREDVGGDYGAADAVDAGGDSDAADAVNAGGDRRATAGDVTGEFTTYVLRHGFVGDSRAAAWEAMREGYLYLQRQYAEIFSGDPVEELSAERRAELKEQAVFGTPEQVVEELERYRDAVGEDCHIIFRTYHPGIGTETMVDCIHRLGDEVRPEL